MAMDKMSSELRNNVLSLAESNRRAISEIAYYREYCYKAVKYEQ